MHRCYGLLLHISSLPSAWGIGDLGPAAHAFAAMLAANGAGVWQFLPLNPTSIVIGNSPYSSLSAFAGNPIFISPEFLLRDGYLGYDDLDASFSAIPSGRLVESVSQVNYEAVTAHRSFLLNAAYARSAPSLAGHREYSEFCRQHDYWLHDYARFVTMKKTFGGVAWNFWPFELAGRDAAALSEWDEQHIQEMEREKFIQFLFFSQWQELRRVCNGSGIKLMADIPIYVTHDSVDVWSHPEYFKLDEGMQPVCVSGVPPDYFSLEGQRWGTPVYRWDVIEKDDFDWWKKRLGHTLLTADMARLDHFRGFCGYWEIPATEQTAVRGEWRCAPAASFFQAIQKHFGCLPFIAEDLGIITPDVREVMAEFNLLGMHVLQFAFSGEAFARNPDIPHAHTARSVVYTGTHDNATTRDWFAGIVELEKNNLSSYAGVPVSSETASRVLTRLAFASVADCAILPVQDALNLGKEGRMNTPGIGEGNWTWRLAPGQLEEGSLAWLQNLAHTYGRLPEDHT